MKVITTLNRIFGERRVIDMLDVKDEDDKAIEYYGIDETEDDSEPSYFVRVYPNSVYQVKAITGDVLHTSYLLKDLRNYLKKVLANNNHQ